MGTPLHILIIEDSEEDAFLLGRKLKDGGFEPVLEMVHSMETMRRALDTKTWDIIISDHSMPHFSALNALEELKARGLDLPVIIVSGTIDPEEAVAAMKAGASDFIMKNDLTRFIPAVERELREAKERRARRQAEEKFLQAQKMESVGRMAGGVAHDFNNVLTAILGFSELALMALPGEHPVKSDLAEIKQSAIRAAALTNQLLAFSRRQVIQPKPTDLNQLLTNLEKMLRRVISENIELSLETAPEPAVVLADPRQLEQVVVNLAINARDAMPDGGRLIIRISTVEAGGAEGASHSEITPGTYAVLSVTDVGHGMTPEVKAHLFEPFFTTKPVGKGTGLGLATCYGIIKQNNGSIEVQSEPNKGATFRLYLPKARQAPEPARADGVDSRNLNGRETVLVVEDEEVIRKLLRKALSERGYTVLEAASPQDALAITGQRREGIHLLLTDIVMPGMSGNELAKRLRISCPALKVILMSGYTDSDMIVEPLGPEVNFMPKPLDLGELLAKMRQVLDGSASAK